VWKIYPGSAKGLQIHRNLEDDLWRFESLKLTFPTRILGNVGIKEVVSMSVTGLKGNQAPCASTSHSKSKADRADAVLCSLPYRL
jgi:hypothetical protein